MQRTSLFLLLALCFACAGIHADVGGVKGTASEAAAEEIAAVQGTWFRYVNTSRGTFKAVKEHKGDETTLTFFDEAGNVVSAKKSKFRIEKTGKVLIFTFFDNVVTAGPQKGLTDKEPQSYIYRITGDTFFEVRGMLIGDADEPGTITWKRLTAP